MEVYWIGDDFIWDWPWRGDNFVFDFVSWRADIVCVNSLNSVMVSGWLCSGSRGVYAFYFIVLKSLFCAGNKTGRPFQQHKKDLFPCFFRNKEKITVTVYLTPGNGIYSLSVCGPSLALS